MKDCMARERIVYENFAFSEADFPVRVMNSSGSGSTLKLSSSLGSGIWGRGLLFLR